MASQIRNIMNPNPPANLKPKTDLPEPNDLVFFAEQSIRAMDIFKTGNLLQTREMTEELLKLLDNREMSYFRRAVVELLVAEVSDGKLQGDQCADPRKHAFEAMKIVEKLFEYGVPRDLESAVGFVGKRAEKIGMPYVEERVKEEKDYERRQGVKRG